MDENLVGSLIEHGSLKGSLSLYSELSWQKIGEADITVNTTDRYERQCGVIRVNDIWTDSEIIYIRIRDKAGKRSGYFLGTDTFFINYKAKNGDNSALLYAGRIVHRYNGVYEQYSGNGYGVYPYSISSDGTVKIYSRYEIGYSRRINGTYRVEVFKLKYPNGLSPFDI
jgi:hypothetical protein